MLDLNHRKPIKTVTIAITILLVTLVFISNKIYSDIRGEFAKRPTALPPEPAAVVDYLKEDAGNHRATSKLICSSGMSIKVNMNQLGATPTFFEAIDQALKNHGMGGFTSKDFLESQPDSITQYAYPQTYAQNVYYNSSKIHIDAKNTNIHFSLTPVFDSGANPKGEFVCSDYFSGKTQLCEVLTACGMTYSNKANVTIGGCLVTTNKPDSVSNIATSLNPYIVIETLTYFIPRRNMYFVNPYPGNDYQTHTLIAQKNAKGNVIGCSHSSLDTDSVCGAGGTRIIQNVPHYQIDAMSATTVASVTGIALSKVPRQDYILAFVIDQCPTS